MRRFLPISLAALLLSCLSETSVDPGSSATFIRYYNGGNNDEAKGLELAPGGYMVMGTTRIQKSEAEIPRTKIKLIKTDASGNPLWQRLYPGFADTDRDYLASAIKAIVDVNGTITGYIIIGDVIKKSGPFAGVSQSFVLKVDTDGNGLDSLDFAFNPGIAEKGRAVNIEPNGIILALSTQGTDNMILTEIDPTTFDRVNTPREFASGETTLSNRLVIDAAGKAVFSGERTVAGETGVRFIRSIPDSPTTDFDHFISEPGYSYAGADFCPFGTGYAILGATNKKPDGSLGQDTDILFFKLKSDGSRDTLNTFPFDDPLTPINEDNQIDAGSAIATTIDGGLVFLSSVNSTAIDGRGDSDFYMIKIDAFGTKIWTSQFGSRFKDEGIAIRALSDGSFLALGTTTQGALKILTLFRTNSNGRID